VSRSGSTVMNRTRTLRALLFELFASIGELDQRGRTGIRTMCEPEEHNQPFA